jgi:hypothetical protein
LIFATDNNINHGSTTAAAAQWVEFPSKSPKLLQLRHFWKLKA